MTRPVATLFAGVSLGLAVMGVAAAGPIEDADAAVQRGAEAYGRGDKAAQLNEELLALRLVRPLADKGEARAQAELGHLYEIGQLRDLKQSVFWFRKAAEHGDSAAQESLGLTYYGGEGVPKDYPQALFWFRKAADQANKGAEFMLGLMYEGGHGVRKDYVQAAAWYRKAAEHGEILSEVSLGDIYRDGEGVPRDFAQAAMWYRKASEQGSASAQNSLGEMYEAGQGVPQDYIQAYMWFNLAASLHESDGPETNRVHGEIYGQARDKVAAKMTPAQIAQAQKLASQSGPAPPPKVAPLSPSAQSQPLE